MATGCSAILWPLPILQHEGHRSDHRAVSGSEHRKDERELYCGLCIKHWNGDCGGSDGDINQDPDTQQEVPVQPSVNRASVQPMMSLYLEAGKAHLPLGGHRRVAVTLMPLCRHIAGGPWEILHRRGTWGSLGQSAARAIIHTGSLKCDWPTLYRWGMWCQLPLMVLLGNTSPATP